MPWTVLALQVVAAQPAGGLPNWFSPDDMPAGIQQSMNTYIVGTSTTVGPNGRPINCQIDHPTADPNLDALTCALILRRARFTPARWIDGSAAYGLYRMPVKWTTIVNDRGQSTDLQIQVNKLPAGSRSPVRIRLIYAADSRGHIVSCTSEPIPGQTRPRQINPQLIQVACSELERSWIPIPVHDASGAPVRSVQNASADITAP
jgi:hypothetical protein